MERTVGREVFPEDVLEPLTTTTGASAAHTGVEGVKT